MSNANSSYVTTSAPVITTSVDPSSQAATPLVRLIGATILAILVIVAVTINMVLLIVYIRGSARFKNTAPIFFTIAFHMVLADLQSLVSQVFLVAPESLAGESLFSPWLTYFLGSFDTYGYETAFLLALLLTFSRFCTFMAPNLDQMIFQHRRVQIIIAAIWIIVIAQTIANNFVGCYKQFETDGYYLYYADGCFSIANSSGLTKSYVFNGIVDFFFDESSSIYAYVPVAIILLYAMIYVKIRLSNSHQNDNTQKMEMKFLLQSFIICLVLFAEDITFIFVPELPTPGQWQYVANFFTDYLVVISECVHAIVIFCFNSTAREVFGECFYDIVGWKNGQWRGQSTTTGTTMPTMPTTNINIASARMPSSNPLLENGHAINPHAAASLPCRPPFGKNREQTTTLPTRSSNHILHPPQSPTSSPTRSPSPNETERRGSQVNRIPSIRFIKPSPTLRSPTALYVHKEAWSSTIIPVVASSTSFCPPTTSSNYRTTTVIRFLETPLLMNSPT